MLSCYCFYGTYTKRWKNMFTTFNFEDFWRTCRMEDISPQNTVAHPNPRRPKPNMALQMVTSVKSLKILRMLFWADPSHDFLMYSPL